MDTAGRLRVALIAGTLGQGGAEKQLVYMARALRSSGAEVAVFSLTSGEHHERALAELGIEPRSVTGSRAAKLAALARGVARFRPHVVQAGHTYTGLYAALAGSCAGALTLGALRSSLAHSVRGNGLWTRWHLTAPHAVIVNSSSASEDLARAGWKRPVYLVPNAIDGEARGPGPRGPRERIDVAFVARLVPEKRLDLFLETIALARAADPRVHGVVIGDGPARSAGEARARDLGIAGHVSFLGRRDDVPALLDAADMLLLCSDEEGFPNVLLEAMAAGLPVVTRPAGDAAAVVKQEETGFVVSGGAEEMADRVVLLARSPDLRARMGDAGRTRASNEYGFGKLCTRLLGVYRDLAERRGHRRTLDALA
jgi:glycosyltransferase involved in cell wall biosynthesis